MSKGTRNVPYSSQFRKISLLPSRPKRFTTLRESIFVVRLQTQPSISPKAIILSIVLLLELAPKTFANENLSEVEISDRHTPVERLADIKTTDWSFQALKSLLERYRVTNKDIFPSQITRYEFASLLNAVIKRCNDLNIQEKTDLGTIHRLQLEFASELALQRRTDNLATKISQLETQQFSPTTKLSGEVIFAVSGARGSRQANDGEEVEENLILSDRVWLSFDTSFTGSDRLRVRLEAENTPGFDDATGTEMARLGFEGDSNNAFDINQLEYSFPIGKQTNLYITTDSTDVQIVANSTNSFSSSGRGAISRFGRYSPIYRKDFGAAVRLKYEFSDAASFSVGFGDANAEDDEDTESSISGKTDGTFVQMTWEPNNNIELVLGYLRVDERYGAVAQLILEPVNDISLGLTYLRSYNNLATNTGSELANDPFDDESSNITTNAYGVETRIKVNPSLTISSWLGLTTATAEDILGKPRANIFHYAVTLAFPDLGKENSLAGIVIGQPPKVTDNDLGANFTDKDTSLHLEFFYRWQAGNIAITPGLLVIANPEHNSNNDTIYIGTVRTTFKF